MQMPTTDDEPTPPSEKNKPPAKQTLFRLPNELISAVLLHLDPVEVLIFGRSCHKMLGIVNEEANRVSARILQREGRRLEAERRIPTLIGISLVAAIRTWMIYRGILAERTFRRTSQCIADIYVRANSLQPRLAGSEHDAGLFRRLVAYLLHLNYAMHYPTYETSDVESPVLHQDTCNCILCVVDFNEDRSECCWIETRVKAFGRSAMGWLDDTEPAAFLDSVTSPATKDIFSLEKWLEMIQEVWHTPLMDHSDRERKEASLALYAKIDSGVGFKGPHKASTTFWFSTATGLPKLRYCCDAYAPEMDVAVQRRFEHKGTSDIGRMVGRSRVARATEEFCHRAWRQGEQKMLDPENRMLVAVIFEGLHIVPKTSRGYCSRVPR